MEFDAFDFEPEDKKTPAGTGKPRRPRKIRRSDDLADNEPSRWMARTFSGPATRNRPRPRPALRPGPRAHPS